MNYNHNCTIHFVKMIQPQLIQINPIIYQHHNYMDHDMSINYGDGGRSEEKRKKDSGGWGRSEEKRSYAVSSKQSNQLEVHF